MLVLVLVLQVMHEGAMTAAQCKALAHILEECRCSQSVAGAAGAGCDGAGADVGSSAGSVDEAACRQPGSGRLGCGSHTDCGFLTLLVQDGEGLEVCTPKVGPCSALSTHIEALGNGSGFPRRQAIVLIATLCCAAAVHLTARLSGLALIFRPRHPRVLMSSVLA